MKAIKAMIAETDLSVLFDGRDLVIGMALECVTRRREGTKVFWAGIGCCNALTGLGGARAFTQGVALG